MTNKEWLDYLAHNAPDELAAWFDAEHVETEERALDGDTDALNAKIAALEKKLRISWEYECKFQDERDALQEQVDTLRSRHCPHYDATEHTCDVHRTRIAELTAERDELQAQLYELTADCDMLENERDNLEAKCDGWKKHVMAIENAYSEALQWRDEYRSKFGKCIDYADAIHALMDDEGMA